MLKKTGNLLWTAIATCWVLSASAADVDAEAAMQAGLDAWQAGDMIGAMRHYQAAADAGIPLAQAKLGYIYDQSNDDELAVKWYRAAAEQQHPDGEFGLGEMYAKGEGVEQDLDMAVELFMRAAVNGHDSRHALSRLEHGVRVLGKPIVKTQGVKVHVSHSGRVDGSLWQVPLEVDHRTPTIPVRDGLGVQPVNNPVLY